MKLPSALVHNSDRGRELAWPRLPSSDHLAIRHPERRHGVQNLAPDLCLDSLCRQPRRVQKHKRTQGRRVEAVSIASCPKTQTNSRLARRAVSIVIDPWRAPDLGRVGGDVGDSGSPYAQGKHRPAMGCHAPERRPGSRPGPHLDQNVLAGYAAAALALILDPSGGLFSDATRPGQRPFPYLAQTWHSKIGIRDEYRK